jgi:FMN-dependent NADH-azoreductase
VSLFRLDASIRTDGSHSREIADLVEKPWLEAHPDVPVVKRDLGRSPLPTDAWGNAVAAGSLPAEQRTPEQSAAAKLAAELVDELVDADAYVFALPLYNFGVSQHFKAWVDLVITDPRMAPGTDSVKGRPAVVVAVRGGGYGPGTPREGWDHSTGWVLRILSDVWGLDVKLIEADMTLSYVVPDLAQFQPVADEFRAKAEASAAIHGAALTAVRTT